MAAKEYPVQILIYVTKQQADAIHAMTTNVSAWVRKQIDNETARIERKAARAKASEATK